MTAERQDLSIVPNRALAFALAAEAEADVLPRLLGVPVSWWLWCQWCGAVEAVEARPLELYQAMKARRWALVPSQHGRRVRGVCPGPRCQAAVLAGLVAWGLLPPEGGWA